MLPNLNSLFSGLFSLPLRLAKKPFKVALIFIVVAALIPGFANGSAFGAVAPEDDSPYPAQGYEVTLEFPFVFVVQTVTFNNDVQCEAWRETDIGWGVGNSGYSAAFGPRLSSLPSDYRPVVPVAGNHSNMFTPAGFPPIWHGGMVLTQSSPPYYLCVQWSDTPTPEPEPDPVDPVDPTDPTDPVDPVDPTDPTDPSDPVVYDVAPEKPRGDFASLYCVAWQEAMPADDGDVLVFGPTVSELPTGWVERATPMDKPVWTGPEHEMPFLACVSWFGLGHPPIDPNPGPPFVDDLISLCEYRQVDSDGQPFGDTIQFYFPQPDGWKHEHGYVVREVDGMKVFYFPSYAENTEGEMWALVHPGTSCSPIPQPDPDKELSPANPVSADPKQSVPTDGEKASNNQDMLPETGGPALALLIFGLLAALAGVVTLRLRR